ncbi:thioredoxin-like protein [Mycena sanguinolenta]|nr:thioredoxin-like protein [Mycena sanguinolenta]
MLVGLHRLLPVSLFLTCLSLGSLISSVSASAVSHTDSERPLSLSDYRSGALSKGVWFIQFFSPWCGHCRQFAPTWEKLVEDSGVPAGVQFARVDCSVDGDLCNALGVLGYPQLNLYRDGVLVDKYQGSRGLDLLVKYLEFHVPTPPSSSSIMRPNTAALTEYTFHPTIANGPWLVFYSTPWCGHCKRFTPTWEKLVAQQSALSTGVQLARVECVESQAALCIANNIRGYPTLNLYRDGDLVDTYYGPRELGPLTKYLADALLSPTPPPTANLEGKVSVLAAYNFSTTISQGPAFVSFIPQHCHNSDQCRPEVWRTLATIMRGSTTIAEVNCGVNRSFCRAHGITLGAAKDSTLIYFSGGGSAGVQYTGPRTLMQLKAFVKVGGIYPPPAMEFSKDTYEIVKAQPITVMASPGTDTVASVADRMREIARVWNSLHSTGPVRTVQFAWEDPRREDGVVRPPPREDVGVTVGIIDHDDGSPGYGKIYYTEGHVEEGTEPQPLKLTTESIFSVLEDVAGVPRHLSLAQEAEKVNSCHGIVQQTMQYLYSADAYISAHPLKTLYMLSISLALVYVVLQRFLRAKSDGEPEAEKDLE